MRYGLRLRMLFLLVVAALWAGSSDAQTYTTVVVFGDSLSDTGNVAHVFTSTYGVRYPAAAFNYTDGRFTDGSDTTPAARAYQGVWVEQLAAQFGSRPAVKNSLDGGTNYAYGDATTADGSSTVTSGSISIQVANMGQQVTNYLATSPTPNAATLYVLFGGGNDLFADSSAAAVTAAAQREANLMQRLANAGATNFLVPNLPPLGNTPQYTGSSSAAALNAAAQMFGTMLATDLQVVKMNSAASGKVLTIFQPDLYNQYLAVSANPQAYGFVNLTFSAQGQGPTFNPDTSLFWDSIHPTTTGHHFIASTAENLIAPLVASTTTLTATPATIAAGQTVTLKAVIAGSGPSAKATGLVTFYSGTGGTALATAVLDATGTATATFVGAPSGSPYTITATYAGDLAYARSTSNPQVVTIGSAIATVTTLTASSAAINLGASETLTASVTSSNGTPGGTVTFLDGATSIASVPLSGSGVATLITGILASGTHTITASYAASGNYAASTSAAVQVTVATPSVAVSFAPSTLTVMHGSSATSSVTLTSSGGANGTVTLSCGALPAHTTCSFAPSTLALTPAAPQTSTLTIGTTAAAGLLLPVRPGGWRSGTGWGAAVYAVLLLPLLGFGRRGRRRPLAGLLALLMLGAVLMGTGGCGGASSSAGGGSTTTAPGSYNVVVTATVSAGTTVTSQGTLVVIVQ